MSELQKLSPVTIMTPRLGLAVSLLDRAKTRLFGLYDFVMQPKPLWVVELLVYKKKA